MALNLKDTLEILKRAGLDPDDRMYPSDREQILNERLRKLEQDPFFEDEFPNYRPVNPLTGQEDSRFRRENSQSSPLELLLNIDDL